MLFNSVTYNEMLHCTRPDVFCVKSFLCTIDLCISKFHSSDTWKEFTDLTLGQISLISAWVSELQDWFITSLHRPGYRASSTDTHKLIHSAWEALTLPESGSSRTGSSPPSTGRVTGPLPLPLPLPLSLPLTLVLPPLILFILLTSKDLVSFLSSWPHL